MALKFKLVDMSSQLREAVNEAQRLVDSGSGPGNGGNLHLPLTVEGGQAKVLTVPIQNSPAIDGKYGPATWGPAPQDIRATGYHDPVQPGSLVPDDDDPNVKWVWVQDEGYKLASGAPKPGTGTGTPAGPAPAEKVTIHGCEVSCVWNDRNGQAGKGKAVLANPNTALFSFYTPDNIEIVVAIVGPINGRSLIKVGSLTGEGFSVTVKRAGEARTIDQRINAPLGALVDGFQD